MFPFLGAGANEMWRVHLAARTVPALANLRGAVVLPAMARWDKEYVGLAVVAIILALRRRDARVLFPVAWLGVFVVLFFFHTPVWYHYYLLLAPPLCWLAALGARDLLETSAASRHRAWLRTFGVAALLLLVGVKGARNLTHLRDSRFRIDTAALAAMRSSAGHTHWVLAPDTQIYPFLAGLPVPPELAITSWKRRYLGESNAAYLRRVVAQYRPEQLLLPADSALSDMLGNILTDEYAVRYQGPRLRLLLRRENDGAP